MAAKVTPYFILTADGFSVPAKSDDESCYKSADDIPSIISKNSSSDPSLVPSRKLMTLTRNELTRKRMDGIRIRLEDSRAKYNQEGNSTSKLVPKGGSRENTRAVPRMDYHPHSHRPSITQETKLKNENDNKNVEMVPLNYNKKVDTNTSVPYVYFVVSVKNKNKHPHGKVSASVDEQFLREVSHNRELVSRELRLSTKDNEKLRMQQIASELGLKSEALPPTSRQLSRRSITFPDSKLSPPRNPPTTPAAVGSAASSLFGKVNRSDNDNLSLEIRSTKISFDGSKSSKISLGDVGEITVLDSRPSTKHVHASSRMFELPTISAEQQRKNLGTTSEAKSWDMSTKSNSTNDSSSNNKKVHFSENFDLPIIKGSGIVIGSNGIPPVMIPRASTMPILSFHHDDVKRNREKSEFQLERERTQLSLRSLHSPPGVMSKRNTTLLNLPKIDIVSGVYDELIIKAITNYAKEFSPSSKQGKVARQLLRQLQERSISAADLATVRLPEGMRPGKNRQRATIKELPDDDNVNSTENDGRQNTRGVSKSKDKEFNTITPTCFKMVPPGSEAKTKSQKSSRKSSTKSTKSSMK